MYLYAKDPYEAEYQYLINNREQVALKQYNDLMLSLNTQMIWKTFRYS